jgi:cytochrome c biogenesis protein CcmG, thiol:disulfide interchange protein DsbE
MNMKTIVSAVALLIVLSGLLGMAARPPLVGSPAPEIVLKDLQGRDVKLSDLRGKVVLVNFWATWCKPCKEEMPSMEILWDNFKSEDFVLLAISMDRVTTKKDISPFLESMRLTFPILTDSWGQTDKRYKLMGVPETYIIDQKGVLREKVIGPRDWTLADSVATIVQLLHKQPKSVKAQ